MTTVILATARSQTEPRPVGRLVTGASKSFGVDKGLEPEDGVMVKSLPIVGNSFGSEGKQVRGEVRHLNPRQNKESGVVGQ